MGNISFSQQPTYSIKGGEMHIIIPKKIAPEQLNIFIEKYDFKNLLLAKAIKEGFIDSISKNGWRILNNNSLIIELAKPFGAAENLEVPQQRIVFTSNESSLNARFPREPSGIVFGYNMFRKKKPFAISDSVVTFFLRGKEKAQHVFLAGSFNRWRPDTLPMLKVDSGWVVNVTLLPGKYWYKFVVDGLWEVDADNRLSEHDGEGNINSVFFKPNFTFTLKGFENAKQVYVAGSFNKWRSRELALLYDSGDWKMPIYLQQGTYTYRFVVDKKWMMDSASTKKISNEYGAFNSVLEIGTPYKFFLQGYDYAKRVSISGSFNEWRKDEWFLSKIDSGWMLPYVLRPGNYQYKYYVDGNETTLTNQLLCINPNYTFFLKGYENAKTVYLAGDFNNWDPTSIPFSKTQEGWEATIHINPGKQRYKYIVDGKWILDPGNKFWEDNEYSTGNSILWIDYIQ